jgi:hypothetical protein
VSEIDDLRIEVARLRRAATRKISRIKTIHGARVSGTEFDPRRSAGSHSQYTSKQLSAYRERLQEYLSRQNQFVPDALRRPVPRAEFMEYKRAEQQYRESAGQVFDRIKDVELPSGETIVQRLAKMDVLHKQMHNPSVNMIFDPHTREAMDITSRDAMRKLTKSMKRDSSPASIRRKINQARQQFAQMMDTINMPELYAATKSLNNNQFVALWNYRGFASVVSFAYEMAKKMLSPKDESWGHQQLRDQMMDAMEMVDWARQLKV